jgi:quercetin dioxygenase-like cupin family protein
MNRRSTLALSTGCMKSELRKVCGASIFAMAAIALCLPATAQTADTSGMKRTILHQADLSGANGMEVISSILEVQPGAGIPRHFHNGVEAGRVLEGAMIQLPDKEPQMLATGTPIFQLRGVMHAGFKVVGDKALKLYTVHVVDKDKPLFDGVK